MGLLYLVNLDTLYPYRDAIRLHCIAELAQEFKIIITHNYAPTTSFKTMVDRQGDLTKSTYRRLEKSKIEGTRCPTYYDLFKLFTSDYPMTPVEIPHECVIYKKK